MTTDCDAGASTSRRPSVFLFGALVLLVLIAVEATAAGGDLFSNAFLVRFKRDVEQDEAHLVARRNGFINMGPLLGSRTEYHFQTSALPHARTKRSIPHTRRLKVDPLIHSAVQQTSFVRVKRGYKPNKTNHIHTHSQGGAAAETPLLRVKRIKDTAPKQPIRTGIDPDTPLLRVKRIKDTAPKQPIRTGIDPDTPLLRVKRIKDISGAQPTTNEHHFAQGGIGKRGGASSLLTNRVKRGYKPLRVENLVKEMRPHRDPTDPYFPQQWYLKNTGQHGGKAKLDLNVAAAWAQGFTGKNVTTAIMDDGVDYMHPDLKYNYNARASYDFSSNDPYPYPRYTDDWFNSHGTRCAGEVAAARDNGVCGVGVAYDSLVAGIRMLDQPYMTDLIEANSMGHEPNLIDIYSASWGPTDDGKTVDGPRNATMRAIVRGVNEGRGGFGNIYVWASGDGGDDDDCNCDGYAASMWTVSINSAINDGQNAHYDESCSSTLASTFSNGARDPNTGVATTDLYGKCTTTHSGTSAAAPEAAGVFALALEANRQLTWRDIQHLSVLTSKRNSLFDARGRFKWTMNGVGLEFNHLFGFGVLDAGAMVALARRWKSVPARYHCEAGGVPSGSHRIPSGAPLRLTISTEACRGSDTEVRYLEHVQLVVSANATRRGDLELFLTSPMGTRSMILSRRQNDDDARDGFTKWPFMTTHTWAEYPQGTWQLEARLTGGATPQSGYLNEANLVLHGTRDPPYTDLSVLDPHSKLAIVKKAHEVRMAAARRKK